MDLGIYSFNSVEVLLDQLRHGKLLGKK